MLAIALVGLGLLPSITFAQPAQRQAGRAGVGRQREANWQMPEVQGSNLHYKTSDSRAAGEPVNYLIYLPDAYEQQPERRFPVVYWLHGIGGSQQGVPQMAQYQ